MTSFHVEFKESSTWAPAYALSFVKGVDALQLVTGVSSFVSLWQCDSGMQWKHRDCVSAGQGFGLVIHGFSQACGKSEVFRCSVFTGLTC